MEKDQRPRTINCEPSHDFLCVKGCVTVSVRGYKKKCLEVKTLLSPQARIMVPGRDIRAGISRGIEE